ncbi:MAG TPA: AAA family ATPase [Gemmataceae bacterium]|nr:AAA family ATPase [Gemmataceae bacterium]
MPPPQNPSPPFVSKPGSTSTLPVAAGSRLLHSIALGNFLSFGPETPCLPLGNLNVLVGPNGSGKSNLLEALSLLRSCVNLPASTSREGNDLRSVINRGGGVGEWVWKGAPHGNATLEAFLANPSGSQPLRHVLSFRAEQQSFRIEDESIENERASPGQADVYFYYRYQQGQPMINEVIDEEQRRRLRPIRDKVHRDLSILAQYRDPEKYPELTYLFSIYERIRLYREWAFGRNTVFREPQKADLRNDRLEEDFSNLGLFLNRLRRQSKVKAALLSGLRDLYDGLTDFDISIEGGTVQVFFTEGDFTIPATRLSDGSVRYLCLLAILCDPEPPPLIGLEEPELGLHPDLLPNVADMLVAAAQRTQLIVTTHSDILVDALTERPETLVICEKHEGRTTMRHPPPEEVQPWLEKYRLGQLWTRGQLGGKRW